MLAAEVQLILQAAAGHRLLLNKNRGVPGDFAVPDVVFKAVASRVGELPDLANEIVLLYHRAELLNRVPDQWSRALAEYEAMSGGPEAVVRLNSAKKQLDMTLDVYRSALEKLAETANELLPRLRAAARPWHRIDLLVGKKKLLSVEEMNASITSLHDERLRAGGEGKAK